MTAAPSPSPSPATSLSNEFAGKVALVTGAASGIGRGTALCFARRRASVVVADWNLDGANETVDLIREMGGEAIAVQCDVSSNDSVGAMIHTTLEAYGQLDFAHNNAGLVGAQKPLVGYSEIDFDRIMAVNVKGVYLCMQHELTYMIARGQGVIVNTASEASLKGSAADAAYTASKHAVAGITKTVALEVATKGIRVNAVCPGVISSGMTAAIESNDKLRERGAQIMPVNRYGRPEEIGEAVAWLCSDGASLVTGILLPVDGGWSAK